VVRDLVAKACIQDYANWREVPAEKIRQVCTVARNLHPFLSRYQDDWPVKSMAKQFLKNRRMSAIKRGDVEVKEKYCYLAGNASKRAPGGSRNPRWKLILEENHGRRSTDLGDIDEDLRDEE